MPYKPTANMPKTSQLDPDAIAEWLQQELPWLKEPNKIRGEVDMIIYRATEYGYSLASCVEAFIVRERKEHESR